MPSHTMEEISQFPGVETYGSGNIEIKLGLNALSSLADGSARLKIVAASQQATGTIRIEDFKGNLYLRIAGTDTEITLGHCRQVVVEATLYDDGRLNIGDATSINSLRVGILTSEVTIGSDCMLSHDINMQPNGQHGIIDLSTRSLLPSKTGIVLGDHVWVGRAASLLPGVVVGSGSIIGACSVVTRNVAPCTAVAGAPARLTREQCTWSRSAFGIDAEAERFMESYADHTELPG